MKIMFVSSFFDEREASARSDHAISFASFLLGAVSQGPGPYFDDPMQRCFAVHGDALQQIEPIATASIVKSLKSLRSQ